MLIIFLVTFVIPAISIGFLRITNTITSFKLEERKERILPFIFITVFYGVASWMFMTRINLGVLVNVMLIGITITILLLTIITFFWKISAHGAGVGGVLGMMAIFYLREPALNNATLLTAAVIVAGIVMSSRLKLNSHNPAQVYSGLLLGFFTTFLSIYFFA
jgi:membrane-associated phospholipid phosphatase